MREKGFYNLVVGTGGIGTGVVYRLEGMHDLGRNESRAGHLLPQKDFCKQHIILHYVSRILRGLRRKVRVVPFGAVGRDAAGDSLLELMRGEAMDVGQVLRMAGAPTLYSVCFQYPDSSGGNITESRSAGSLLKVSHSRQVQRMLVEAGERAMVLAAPEAPMGVRARLLAVGRKSGSFTAASFTSEEMTIVREERLLRNVDLLSVNSDEAAALAGVRASQEPQRIVKKVIEAAGAMNPELRLCVTSGAQGIYGYHHGTMRFLPGLKVKVANTAGAGDACMAGLMLGTILGQGFVADNGPSALGFGRALSAMSVLSADTINFDISADTLQAFARKVGTDLLGK